MQSNKYWAKRGNHSSQSAGCGPVDTAQDALGCRCCWGTLMPSHCPPGAPSSFSAELSSSLCMFSCYPFCGLLRRCCFSSLSSLFIACSHLAALSPYAETDACIKLDSDFNISSHKCPCEHFGFSLILLLTLERSCLWYPLSCFLSNLSFANSQFLAMPTKTAGSRCLRWWGAETSLTFFNFISWFHWGLPPSLHLLHVICHTVNTSALRGRNHHWTPHFDSGFVKHLLCQNPGPWLSCIEMILLKLLVKITTDRGCGSPQSSCYPLS